MQTVLEMAMGWFDPSSGNFIGDNGSKQRVYIIDPRSPKQAQGITWTRGDVLTL